VSYAWEGVDKGELNDEFISQGSSLANDIMLAASRYVKNGGQFTDWEEVARRVKIFYERYASIPKAVFLEAAGAGAWAQSDWMERNVIVDYVNKAIGIVNDYRVRLEKGTLTESLKGDFIEDMRDLSATVEASYRALALAKFAIRDGTTVEARFAKQAASLNVSVPEYQYQLSQDVIGGKKIFEGIDFVGEAKRYLATGDKNLLGLLVGEEGELASAIDLKKMILPGLVVFGLVTVFFSRGR
jgi:hypothetical protein